MAAQPALRLQPEEPAPDSWKRFFVVLAGRTNGVHESLVEFFTFLGQTKVTSPGDADYCLVFCPVVSRVGTDVRDAMDHLLPDKEAVLVVMHQTANREQVIPPSSRLVGDQRVRLTLDCLVYREELLQCELNKNMKSNVGEFFGVSLCELTQQADRGMVQRFKESILRYLPGPVQNVFQGPTEKKSNKRPGADSSEATVEKLKNQQTLKDQNLKILLCQNAQIDKKIEKLSDDVAELQQHTGLHVKSGSSGGSVPAVGAEEPEPEEPESMDQQGAAPLQSEDGTKDPQ